MESKVPPFNTLAIECIAAADAAMLPRVPGLTDDLFQGDGTMTKQEVRAISVAKLMPMRELCYGMWVVAVGLLLLNGCALHAMRVPLNRATRR